MSTKRVRYQHSISARLFKTIFGIYFVITLFVTIAQIFLEYDHAKSEIADEIKQIQESFKPSLVQTLWTFNESQLKSIIIGMKKISIVSEVQIFDYKDRIIQTVGNIPVHPGTFDSGESKKDKADPFVKNDFSSDYFGFEFPLKHTDIDGKAHYVGKAVIYSNTAIVFNRVQFGLVLM